MSRGIMAMVLECSNADGLTYDLDKMKKRVLELNDNEEGKAAKLSNLTVRLAASYTVLGYLLPVLLARFRTNYPDIDFDLHDMDRPGIERAVLARAP